MTASTSTRSAAEALLRSKGKRITEQRALILQLIQESREHLDAEQLHRRAKRHDPRINLATVYRTLSLLKESDLVEQRYFARDHHREVFEAKGTPEHYHFTCMGCGTVIEFASPHIEQMRSELKASHGVEFSHACLCFEGLCAACARQPH